MFISLSLSLLSRVIEDYSLKSGKRVNGFFFGASSPSIFKKLMCDVFRARVFVSRAKDKTDERLIAFMFVRVCVYIN